MTREEFINSLSKNLDFLPDLEKNKVIEYYEELIIDGYESGKTEQEIVGGFGEVSEIINKIKEENPQYTEIIKPVKWRAAKIILCVLFFPVIFSLFVAGYSAIFSLVLASFISLLAGFVALITSISLSVYTALFQAGISLVLIGLSTLLGIAGILLFKAALTFTRYFLNKVRDAFTERRVKNEN